MRYPLADGYGMMGVLGGTPGGGQEGAMGLNRTLRQLRNARDRSDPEMYEYAPAQSAPPPGVRYMTLAEAQALECNLCGQCCGSEEADLMGYPLRQYTFGAIPEHQWARLNHGEPLIIPLTPSARPRSWRPADADESKPYPAFRCEALQHHPDGTTRCALWQSRRPAACDAFPVKVKYYPRDLERGIYVLMNTKYQRLCTWVDILLCPEDSVILRWRKADGTLRRGLSADRQAYVSRVFAAAYEDLFPTEGTLPLREWRSIRAAEAVWR